MSTIPRHGAVRSIGAPLLALGSLLVFSVGSLAGGPPGPTITVDASCRNDDLGDKWSPKVDLKINASYKGRWVDFEWTASVDSATSPKGTSPSRWDSRVPFPASATFLTLEPATVAHAEVVVLKKGVPVGDPFVVDPPIRCTSNG